MKRETLSFSERTTAKKGAARRLRRSGKIPSIVYGHNEPVPIAVDSNEFNKKFKTVSESTLITLTSGDQSYDVLVKDYQEDMMRGRIMHIDFYEIEQGKVLRTHVPVHLDGTPVGVKEGGILEHLIHEVEIECLPKDLPEDIVVNVDEMDIGDSIHVSDIPAMDGVKILTSEDQGVCTVTRRRAEEILAAAEAEAEAEEGILGEEELAEGEEPAERASEEQEAEE